MKVNVFPVAVGVANPQPGGECLRCHRLTGDGVHHLSGTDVGDVRGPSFVVEDVNARINHADVVLALAS